MLGLPDLTLRMNVGYGRGRFGLSFAENDSATLANYDSAGSALCTSGFPRPLVCLAKTQRIVNQRLAGKHAKANSAR